MTQKPIKATLDSSDDSVKTQKPILIQLDDIPTPEVEDAGKVLGVDDEGKYALTDGGGGGSSPVPTAILSADEENTINLGMVSKFAGADDTIQIDYVDVSTIGSSLYEKLKPFAESPHYRGLLISNSTGAIFNLYFAGDISHFLILTSTPVYFYNDQLNLSVMFNFDFSLDTANETLTMTLYYQKVNRG